MECLKKFLWRSIDSSISYFILVLFTTLILWNIHENWLIRLQKDGSQIDAIEEFNRPFQSISADDEFRAKNGTVEKSTAVYPEFI